MSNSTTFKRNTSSTKIKWNYRTLPDLYLAHVPNNIVVRLYEHVFNKREDRELVFYTKKLFGAISFEIDGILAMPVNKKYKVLIYTATKTNVPYFELCSARTYLRTVLRKNTYHAMVDKFIMPELRKVVLTADELIRASTGFTHHLSERYNRDNPLPRTFKLITQATNREYLVHNHVAASISKVLYKVIYGGFKDEKLIHLQCAEQTLEWFINGIYAGKFVFNHKLEDHVDGANLLDYLEILTKEDMYHLLNARLFN